MGCGDLHSGCSVGGELGGSVCRDGVRRWRAHAAAEYLRRTGVSGRQPPAWSYIPKTTWDRSFPLRGREAEAIHEELRQAREQAADLAVAGGWLGDPAKKPNSPPFLDLYLSPTV